MKKTKYKKVFSMTGELCLRNYTVKDIIDLKGDRQLTQTLPFTSNEAKAAEDAGIDLINTRFNYLKQEKLQKEMKRLKMEGTPDEYLEVLEKTKKRAGVYNLWQQKTVH